MTKTTMDKNNKDEILIPIRSPLPSPPPSLPEKQKPLFRAPSPDVVLEEEDSSDIEIQDELEVVLAETRIESKGKGKAKEVIQVKKEVVVLSDDDSDDDVQIFSQPKEFNTGQASSSSSKARPPRAIIPPRYQFERSITPSAQSEPLDESEAVQMILSIIPDVLPSHIRSLLRAKDYNNDPNSVVELLLLNGNYPKKEIIPVVSEKKAGKKRAREEQVVEKDYLVIKGRTPGDAEYAKAW